MSKGENDLAFGLIWSKVCAFLHGNLDFGLVILNFDSLSLFEVNLDHF
jgi:hypothetical protein